MPPKRKGSASPAASRGKAPASASRAPLAKAKAAAGAATTEAPPPAEEALAAATVPEAETAPAPEAGPAYEGQPLEVKAAESFLRAMAPADMQDLAGSASPEEQIPPRMMLEFVGDKDFSWKNAQASLKQGEQFKKEILEMEGAKFVTRKSLERFDDIGKITPKELKDKHPVAFAMAVYLEAVIDAAKEKLGLKVKVELALPEPAQEPPAWPIKIPFREMPQALSDAVKFRRTPLFICNGKAATVDTYFSYQACSLIDAKWILNKVSISKELDAAAMREELRKRLVAALKFGQPIHICMSNSAVRLRQDYCSETEFPESLFKMDLWFQKEKYSKVIREEDLQDWPGAWPGRMRDDSATYAFVTTDFGLESVHEFLPAVLPHLESMAFIEIDPESIN